MLILLDGEGVCISARLGEAKIDELEHGLEIFTRAGSAQSFFELADERARRSDLAREHLPEIDLAELAHAAGVDQQ